MRLPDASIVNFSMCTWSPQGRKATQRDVIRAVSWIGELRQHHGSKGHPARRGTGYSAQRHGKRNCSENESWFRGRVEGWPVVDVNVGQEVAITQFVTRMSPCYAS